MAWKGTVVARSPKYEVGELSVVVEFSDESGRVCGKKQIRLSGARTRSDLAAEVRKVGAEERRKWLQAQSLLDQVPVGFEVQI